MKKAIFLLTILFSTFVFCQKKKTIASTNIVPAPKHFRDSEIPPPPPSYGTISEKENCFLYKKEEKKGDLIYVTNHLLEFGRNENNARIYVTDTNYDPIKKQEAEKQGLMLVQGDTVQKIYGKFKIEKGILHFIPNTEKIENRKFKVVYKTNKIDFLKDENGNEYARAKCFEPVIGIGM